MHGFVLHDASGRHTANGWAQESVALYRRLAADRIIGEANNGGDLVEVNIRTADRRVPYRKVHASRGKATRAEPIAALYEQGKVHHVTPPGSAPLVKLEDEMATWDPTTANMPSPNRMDALVWALTELMLGHTVARSGALSIPDLGRSAPWRM